MIEAGPRIDAGPRIQAGGLTHSLVLTEAGGFYPKFYGDYTAGLTGAGSRCRVLYEIKIKLLYIKFDYIIRA